MGFWDILLNENIYISALSSLENPGRYSVDRHYIGTR